MLENDLTAIWEVLETEAAGRENLIKVNDAGVSVGAGDVLLGVDNVGHRHVLVPLKTGETFAEDRNGRAIHLTKVEFGGLEFLSAECLLRDLDGVFVQFVRELLGDLVHAESPALTAVESLAKWRNLFSIAGAGGLLSEPQMIGLLAELLVLESVLRRDVSRRVELWTGHSGSQHDFRNGSDALEVKATLAREGRIVQISSIEQLREPPTGTLHLAHHRFEPDATGTSIPDVVKRIFDLGVDSASFVESLSEVGYKIADQDKYSDRRYRLIDVRFYDASGEAFPRITPESFTCGTVPPGTLRLSYSIDLSNEPPTPLSEEEVETLLSKMGR